MRNKTESMRVLGIIWIFAGERVTWLMQLVRFVFALFYTIWRYITSIWIHTSVAPLPIIELVAVVGVCIFFFVILLPSFLNSCTTRRLRVGRSRVHVELPLLPRPATKNRDKKRTHTYGRKQEKKLTWLRAKSSAQRRAQSAFHCQSVRSASSPVAELFGSHT